MRSCNSLRAVLVWCALAGALAQRLTLFGDENNSQHVREVATCTELKAALTAKVLSVMVADDITCTREGWGEPVRINWNVEIFGRVDSQSRQLMPELDWTDVRKGLVVQKGAVLFIHSLQLRQDSMGIGGIDFAFIETSKGATGVFSGVVVGVRSCPQPVVAYNEIAELIPRPDFLIGEQRTSTLDDSTLLVEDIAIWWPEINSLWQICHAAFLCGPDLKQDDNVLRAQNAIAHTTCVANHATVSIQPEEKTQSDDGHSKGKLKLLAGGASLILVLAAVCVCFLYYRKRSVSKLRVLDDPEKPSVEIYPLKDDKEFLKP